jgi:hypothetical protein
LFTIVVFVLACVGQLKPQMVFLILAGYYFLMLGFGLAVTMLLAVQLGPQNLQGIDVSPSFLRQQFPWFGPVLVAMLVLWVCLAVYGVVAYARANVNGGEEIRVEEETRGRESM